MSDAIEVLKEMKENSNNLGIKYYVKALEKALLALEQNERVKEYINNKINLLDCWKRTDKFAEARINELVEILKELEGVEK